MNALPAILSKPMDDISRKGLLPLIAEKAKLSKAAISKIAFSIILALGLALVGSVAAAPFTGGLSLIALPIILTISIVNKVVGNLFPVKTNNESLVKDDFSSMTAPKTWKQRL